MTKCGFLWSIVVIITTGVSEGSHPTQQELLHQRLHGDNGTDEAFYSPVAINEPLLLHRSPDSSPEIRCVYLRVCVCVRVCVPIRPSIHPSICPSLCVFMYVDGCVQHVWLSGWMYLYICVLETLLCCIICILYFYNLQCRLNPPTPGSGNSSSSARETKLHSLSRWDVIIEDLSSEEDDVATEEWALISSQ